MGTGALMPVVGGTGVISRMSTALSSRRRGVGSALLGELLAEARRREWTAVTLETTATWTDARRFYEHHGFVLDRLVAGIGGDDAHYRLEL